jgi:hypothetical protein
MRSCARLSVFAGLACVLSLAVAGCGVSYPYYTIEGSPESRVVEIHLGEGKSEKVPCGQGVGAGLTADHWQQMQTEGHAIVEKGAARVTITAKGPAILVKSVEYDGKDVPFHEPIL